AAEGVPAKFVFHRITDDFTAEPSADAPADAPVGTEPVEAAAPVEASAAATSTSEEGASLLADLKKQLARAKRFGKDTAELEKVLARAEKFGTQTLMANKTLGRVDKALSEEGRRGRGDSGAGGAPSKAGVKKPPRQSESAVRGLSAEDEEKMKRRAERFSKK
ncbi:uncharacterized protein V1518DRAFT_367546, partial [Limtongia smithiae]|uniref:uncharacterized protein n=1 Tax=Limtongia smithiae TaxID=1125753 RepID=UPI0034CFD21F